jgi:hypothetical protein
MRPNQRATQYLVKKARYDATDGYELSLSQPGRVFVRFNQASSGNTYRMDSASGYPFDGSTWLHVAATYDSQEIKLYLDGVLENSLPAPGLVIGANDLPLSMGAQDDGVQPFDGALDEVQLYDYALTEAEIQDLIASSLPPDADGDGKPDEQDECTTTAWSPLPRKPPDQHPLAFGLALKNLATPGEHRIEARGFFNPAPSGAEINPAANGVHVRIADERGLLYDVSIPGSAARTSPCGVGDGWRAYVRPGAIRWAYRNISGALPPSCEPGSAKGITRLQISNRERRSKGALEFKVLAEATTLVRTPSLPVRRIQFDLALGAQPSQGEASEQAMAGACAEALIVQDSPPASRREPGCEVTIENGLLQSLECRGS